MMDEDVSARFIEALDGHRFKALYLTMIFIGMRLGEVCGLQWECVDLSRRTILIDKERQVQNDSPSEANKKRHPNG